MQDVTESLAGELVADGELPPGAWLPPAVAASRLGVSERTLWRLVKAGRYHRRVADRKAMILVPTTAPLPDTSATSGSPTVPDNSVVTVSGSPSGVTDTTTLAIVGELRRQHEASLALIAQQAETIGRLTAENEALRAAQAALGARTAAQSVETAPGPFSGRLHEWIAAAVAVLAIVIVVVLLAWPH